VGIEHFFDHCNCSRDIPVFGNLQNLESFDWCSKEASLLGYSQNVVTYSLYGEAINQDDWELRRYFSLLDAIPLQVSQFYPGNFILHNTLSAELFTLLPQKCLNQSLVRRDNQAIHLQSRDTNIYTGKEH
jgi:hypothetical protein